MKNTEFTAPMIINKCKYTILGMYRFRPQHEPLCAVFASAEEYEFETNQTSNFVPREENSRRLCATANLIWRSECACRSGKVCMCVQASPTDSRCSLTTIYSTIHYTHIPYGICSHINSNSLSIVSSAETHANSHRIDNTRSPTSSLSSCRYVSCIVAYL